MQLNKKSYAAALSVATCALLGNQAHAETEPDAWKFDSAVMYYGEQGRVQALEGIFAAKKTFENSETLDLKVTFDTLTGASANGAVPQSTIQTFTRPSGNGNYQVKPGDTPLDDTFRDTRVQFNAQWTQPWSRLYTVSGGVHLSNEYDYLSMGVNGSIARDLNNRNTTLMAGASLSYDIIHPEGGLPMPFSSMSASVGEEDDEYDNWFQPSSGNLGEFAFRDDDGEDDDDEEYKASRGAKDDSKVIIDLLFGVTQVVNKNMITQFNYSYSQVDGYQTDPFKVLSVVDDTGTALDHIYESRPNKRTKQSVFAQAKYHVSGSVIDASYRYLWDDWQVKSDTIDLRLWTPVGSSSYLEPHVRYYQQQAAEFYMPFIAADSALPNYASADYRVGDMTATTLGVKYGQRNEDGTEWSVRVEWYHQQSNDVGVTLPGQLQQYDLYPDVDAVVIQYGYRF
jgi:hypothetical protein